MRHRPRLDKTQREVVDTLRADDFSVYSTAAIGHGFPDLVAGKYGLTWLVEVKTPRASKANPDGRLRGNLEEFTPEQRSWISRWRGAPPVIVYSGADALAKLRALARAALEDPHAPRLAPVS